MSWTRLRLELARSQRHPEGSHRPHRVVSSVTAPQLAEPSLAARSA